MPNDDSLYVEHMLTTARKIAARTAGVSRVQYDASEDLQIIFTHLVQIIGEAAARISSATRDAHPEIPWKKIIGMRHRLVHDYLHVDLDILWTVITERIPELIELMEPLTGEGESGIAAQPSD